MSDVNDDLILATFSEMENRISELEEKLQTVRENHDTHSFEIAELENRLSGSEKITAEAITADKREISLIKKRIAELRGVTHSWALDVKNELKELKEVLRKLIKAEEREHVGSDYDYSQLLEKLEGKVGSARQTVTCKECTRDDCKYQGTDCENCGFGTTEIKDSGDDSTDDSKTFHSNQTASKEPEPNYIEQILEEAENYVKPPKEPEPSFICANCGKSVTLIGRPKFKGTLYCGDCYDEPRENDSFELDLIEKEIERELISEIVEDLDWLIDQGLTNDSEADVMFKKTKWEEKLK